MLEQTLKSLLARKLRLLLTAAAIVLGVGVVSGTFVLTDSVGAKLRERTAVVGVDVQVRARYEVLAEAADPNRPTEPVPATLLARVQRVEGVRAAFGWVAGTVERAGAGGEPERVLARSVDPSWAGDVTAGRLPSAPGEVAIDQASAERDGVRLGDPVRVGYERGGPRTLTVVGTVRTGRVGGGALVGLEAATARRLLGDPGRLGGIDVQAAGGTTRQTLRDRVAGAVGDGYGAITGAEVADAQAGYQARNLSQLNAVLLAFGLLALLVGALVMHNTFAITVAQRTRELALLRCLGASRGQVRRSVLLEALAVGAAASVVGLALGTVAAFGIRSLLEAAGEDGQDLPVGTLLVTPRTIAVALGLGIAVTVLSALTSARQATRVPPVAALRAEAAIRVDRRASLVPVAVGTLVTLAGAGAVAAGLTLGGAGAASLAGAGAAGMLLGVIALGPVLAPALARVVGLPVERGLGPRGRLARLNAARNPRRTAATAAALLVGLTLVSVFAVLAASTEASVRAAFDRRVRADYELEAGADPIDPAVVGRLEAAPELGEVVAVRAAEGGAAGFPVRVAAADPATLRRVALDVTQGGLGDLTAGGVAVARTRADANGWRVGSPLRLRLPGGQETFTVSAVYDDADVFGVPVGGVRADYLLTEADGRRLGVADLEWVYVKAAAGVTPRASRAAVERALAGDGGVRLRDRAALLDETLTQFDQATRVYVALFGLSVLAAGFGIANTLALSVVERVREVGLLRAVGMQRRQVASMIRWEAVIIAGIGTLLGVGLGVCSGWALVASLRGAGLEVVSLPAVKVAAAVALVGLLAVLAAALPARRASRIDVLRAITPE
jgi:putative ABC transport system permease protein